MGACVLAKSKHPRDNVHQLSHVQKDVNDLETRQFGQNYDKKTARAFNKQSQERMNKFMEPQPSVHDILVTETTKQPGSEVIKTQNKIERISIKSGSSFCQSVQKQFELFESFSEWEKEQTYLFLKDQTSKNVKSLDETSDVQMEQVVQIDEAPQFLRKYLPMQEYSIQIKYL